MRVRVRDACVYCARRENLRRTVPIALVVGLVLTLINQGGVIAGLHALRDLPAGSDASHDHG